MVGGYSVDTKVKVPFSMAAFLVGEPPALGEFVFEH
jgi:hypothetical protein